MNQSPATHAGPVVKILSDEGLARTLLACDSNRLADPKMSDVDSRRDPELRRNGPVHPTDSVVQTLGRHAPAQGLFGVMMKFWHDLTATLKTQDHAARMTSARTTHALSQQDHNP